MGRLLTAAERGQMEKNTKEVLEDMGLAATLLKDLIYFVHVGDITHTEADWLGMGTWWRDRYKTKTFESSSIHIGRCKTCRKRLKELREKLNI